MKQRQKIPDVFETDTKHDGRTVVGWLAIAALSSLGVVVSLLMTGSRYTSHPAVAEVPPSAVGAFQNVPDITGSINPPATVGTMHGASPAEADTATLSSDIAALRQAVATLRQQNDMLVERIDGLEKAHAAAAVAGEGPLVTGSITVPPSSASSSASSSLGQSVVTGPTHVGPEPAEPPLPQIPPGQPAQPMPPAASNNAPPDAPPNAPVASLAKPVAVTPDHGEPDHGAPDHAAAAASYGIEIGSFTTTSQLASRWKQARQKVPAVLAGLTPLALPYDAHGTARFHLVAGPFRTAEDAALACGTVSSEGIACRPATYTGQPLTTQK